MPRQRTVFLICEECGAEFSISPSRVLDGRGRFCSRKCWHASRAWSIDRFWARVDRSGECWLWMRARFPAGNGYGAVSFRGKVWRAHRVAWTITTGEIPPGMDVLHHCDNPPCVRPDHLFLGVDLDNARDMMRKGRNMHITRPETIARGEKHGTHTRPDRVARGDRSGARVHRDRMPRGERHGMAKLTDVQVRTIQERYALGDITQRQLAREFGLAQSHVWRILKGMVWSHLNSAV
jgi:hypothetical protein